MKPTDTKNSDYFHRVIDCQYACPAHTPVPQYIRHISRKEYDQAYRTNWMSNVFPGVLGRICDRPCEPACRRGRIEKEPVAICRLKRLAADAKSISAMDLSIDMKKPNGKKIALIGGGPASLTVARDLAPLGYEVHLFDDQTRAGGFIRTQVPSFRLPEDVLNEEINTILEMGIKCHQDTYIDSLKDQLDKDFDAIFVGTGAPRGKDLPNIKGRQEGDEFIQIGIEWLAAVLYQHVKKVEPTVLVLGGGNTAMDCCRTARRLGGETVQIVVRSPKAKMKASPWEIRDAEKEGVQIVDNHRPKEFVMENGKLKGVLFDEMTEKEGKLIETGEEIFINCDQVILAVGQENAFPWIEEEIGLKNNKWGLPEVNEITFQSSIGKLFFGGDAAFGPKNVITAVAHGHQAAISIDLFCQGKDLVNDRPQPKINLVSQKLGLYDWAYDSAVSDDLRNQVPTISPIRSIQDRLLEVELGFDEDVGHQEAERCLNCDVQTIFTAKTCIECESCVDICPVNCINFTGNKEEDKLRAGLTMNADDNSQALYVSEEVASGLVMVKDENVCLHCGLCADRCPTASWEMVKFTYQEALAGDK
ncbi:MAG: FAD-dependent oxidoreductase [Desulfotalea sp.]